MTIEYEAYYLQGSLIAQLRNRGLVIAHIKPPAGHNHEVLLKQIRNAEPTASTMYLFNDTNPNLLMDAIKASQKASQMNYILVNNNLDGYPGLVICVNAQELTNQLVANRFFQLIYELSNGFHEDKSFEHEIFIAISTDISMIEPTIHPFCLELTRLAN